MFVKQGGRSVRVHFLLLCADSRVSYANFGFKLILALSLFQIVEDCLSEGFVAQEVLAFVESMVCIRSSKEFLFFEHFGQIWV